MISDKEMNYVLKCYVVLRKLIFTAGIVALMSGAVWLVDYAYELGRRSVPAGETVVLAAPVEPAASPEMIKPSPMSGGSRPVRRKKN